jgi:hypothetical protein
MLPPYVQKWIVRDRRRYGRLGSVKQIRMVLATAVLMVAMLLVLVIPAFAALTHYFFIPEQEVLGGVPVPAQTITCEDTYDPINAETCRFIGLGNQVPADLICDVPVTLELAGEPLIPGLTVYQCRTVEEEAPAEPLPALTQEGEQEGESGEIDQSYDVS